MIIIHIPAFINPMPLSIPELKSQLIGARVSSGALLYDGLWDTSAPLASWLYALCEMLFGKAISGYRILALLIIFFQAAYFSIIIIKSRAFNENAYVGGIVYVLLFYFSPDTIVLSPLLMAMPFLLLALDNIFGLLAFRLQKDETFLSTGVLLSIASLLDFSQIIFLIFTLLVLLVFARTEPRKLLLVVYGFIIPHALLFTAYFMLDKTELLWQNFYLANLVPEIFVYVNLKTILYLGAIPGLFLFFSAFWLNRGGRLTNYQSQLAQVMFFWLLFGSMQIWYGAEINPQAFIILIPPFAFFISHYFLLIRRRRIAGNLFWIFTLSIIGINYLSRQERIPSLALTSLYVKSNPHSSITANKNLLVLGPEIHFYNGAKLGGAFLDNRLSQKFFSQANTYKHLIYLNESLSKDLPELIIDEKDLMAPFFSKLPKLRSKYIRRNGMYFLIN